MLSYLLIYILKEGLRYMQWYNFKNTYIVINQLKKINIFYR